MTNVRQLIIGIVLVIIALALLLTSGNGLLPYLGALIGIVGAVMIIRGILRSGSKTRG